MELQELVARARLLFRGAAKRQRVFELVNSKRSAKEIARRSTKSLSATLQDLQKMRDMDLITARKVEGGQLLKRDGSMVYEKQPLLKHLSKSYFEDPTQLPQAKKNKKAIKRVTSAYLIRIPTEQEVLDICGFGEDQIYEFKRAGGEIRDITKEICAFANTRAGGLIFYGVEDDGTISGSDMRRQKFDERLQGSINSNISPALTIKITEREILGHKILIVLIPPWNKLNVYQMDGRVYIRKGTIKTIATPEEARILHQKKYII